MERWREKEILNKTNQVNCVICGDKQDAERNLLILEGPEILIIQFKRYLQRDWKKTGAPPETVKIDQKIAWSKILNLKRMPSWEIQGTVQKYMLKGVIEHRGKTINDGHYTAYVREGEKWTQWNDENSEEITWEEVQSKEAYILIWEKMEERSKNEEETWSEKCEEEETAEYKNTQKKQQVLQESTEMDVELKGKKRRRETNKKLMSNERTSGGDEKSAKRKRLKETEEIENLIKKVEGFGSRQSKKDQDVNREKVEREEIPVEGSKSHNKINQFKNVKNKNTELEMKGEKSMRGDKWSLEEVVKILHKDMIILTERVMELTKENRELKAWARAIGTKIRKIEEEDDGSSMWEGIAEMEDESSPTPVCHLTENTTRLQKDINREDECPNKAVSEVLRDREYKEINKIGARGESRTKKQERDSENKERRESPTAWNRRRYIESLEMEVEEEEEEEQIRHKPRIEQKVIGNKNSGEIPHRSFLETCYRRQIGLAIEKPQKVDIFSYTHKRVAIGYQRIVTTCQGMYFEMREEDVE